MIDKSADLKSSFSSFICDRCSLLLRQECVYFWLADSNSKKLQDLESLQLKIKINFLFCYIFAGSRNQSQRDLSDTEGKLPAPRRACQAFFFSLCPYATDKRRERLRKHKRESSARKASFSGFLSISKKSSFQRNESIRWEICTSEKKQVWLQQIQGHTHHKPCKNGSKCKSS